MGSYELPRIVGIVLSFWKWVKTHISVSYHAREVLS